jgi:hypothetical protein
LPVSYANPIDVELACDCPVITKSSKNSYSIKPSSSTVNAALTIKTSPNEAQNIKILCDDRGLVSAMAQSGGALLEWLIRTVNDVGVEGESYCILKSFITVDHFTAK